MAVNKASSKKISRVAAALILGLSIFALVSVLYLSGALDFVEYKTYDFRVRFFAEKDRPSDSISLILVNQASLDWARDERNWSWPWPRAAYAEIIDYLNLGGAASLSFDIVFSEPSVYGEADDKAFAGASERYGKVGQTVFFNSSSFVTQSWPSGLAKPLFTVEGAEKLPLELNIENRVADNEFTGMVLPIPELRNAAGALGNITGIADSDGIFRRLSPFILFDGKAVPGLSMSALIMDGNGTDIAYNGRQKTFAWGPYTIPVDKSGKALLRFRGSLGRYTPYSAAEVLQSAAAHKAGAVPALLPEDFTGQHVFFGLYAPGLFDICATPIESSYPGMGMHVTMLDNMLRGDFIRESPFWAGLLINFVVVILIAFIALASNRIPLLATVAVSAALLAVVIVACFAAYKFGLWIPMAAPLSGGLLAFLAGTLYNYATEGKQKRFIKMAFSSYLSPAVVDQVIADPSQLKLGGEKREMTAIFTDVRSFSTISEALGDPAKLVELLNHYLTRMSDIILANRGTIDKYEGDAIIAFFGAPIYLKNHASLACRSAIKMKKAETAINKEAIDSGLINNAVMEALFRKGIITDQNDPSPLFTRLGVNTGDMVVGNMGTPSKMDYTIMGNAVNLAARLEGVNKQYNTGGILISEYTRAALTNDEFVTRPLSRVRVVGINTPLRLYELLDLREEAPPELLEMAKTWEKAFAAYEKRDFANAANIFGSIYEQNPSDLAAKKYFDRCAAYQASPPPAEKWDDGVDNLSEK
ncbi:MAG: adenylate/guanylate cyclase domain-containing protein [Spirochaetaceae bacterium]|jgi:class 3 adenylate cyclase/CHASE2 domain-containing sensor protein|nr:adenylate/guanylate cyclase domain-containing protein [Spirochaetaceae bacterium]